MGLMLTLMSRGARYRTGLGLLAFPYVLGSGWGLGGEGACF